MVKDLAQQRAQVHDRADLRVGVRRPARRELVPAAAENAQCDLPTQELEDFGLGLVLDERRGSFLYKFVWTREPCLASASASLTPRLP